MPESTSHCKEIPSSAGPRKVHRRKPVKRSRVDKRNRLNSDENLEPVSDALLGLESTDPVPIISGSQIEVETEMDVLTSSITDVVHEESLSAPVLASAPVPALAHIENTKSDISDPNTLVLHSDDFGIVVDQLVVNSSSSQDGDDKYVEQSCTKNSAEEVQLDMSGVNGRNTSASAKTQLKCSMKQPRKKVPVKKSPKSDKQSGSRPRKRKSSLMEQPSDNISKPRKKLRKEPKKNTTSPLQVSSETQCESNETSLPSKKGRQSAARKRLKPPTTTSESPTIVKRPRGRPRKHKCNATEHPKLCDETKLSLTISETEQAASEDSGYPSSSANSRSPTDCVLTSPIILQNSNGFLHAESFQETSSPILHDSSLGVSKSETDIGCEITGSQMLGITSSPAETDYSLLHDMQPGLGVGENEEMEAMPSSTQNIFQDLDMLLSQDLNPDQFFDLNGNSNQKMESSNEVEDILQSPSVSNCLKDLQLAGALPSCHSSQVDETGHIKDLQLAGALSNDSSSQVDEPAHNVQPSDSSGQRVTADHLPDEASVEIDKLASDSKTGVPPHTGSRPARKIIVVQRRKKSTHSKPPPLVRSKSGRQLKRTWKLCSDKSACPEKAQVDSAKKVYADSDNKLLKKELSEEKETTYSNDVRQDDPSVHPTDLREHPSAGVLTVSCELTSSDVPGIGDSVAVTECTEELMGGFLSSTSQKTPKDPVCLEPKDEITSDDNPQTDIVGTNSTLTSSRRTIQEKMSRKLNVTTTEMCLPQPRTLDCTLRDFELKLNRHAVESYLSNSSSSDVQPDGDVADLPSSNTSPLVNAMKEPVPVKAADAMSVLKPSFKKGKDGDSRSSKTERIIGAHDMDPCQVHMFNRVVPDQKKSLFSGNRTPAGSIFNNNLGGRIGSIFASTGSSQATSGSSSFAVPHLANAATDDKTTSRSSQPNSNDLPSSSSVVSPSSTGVSSEQKKDPLPLKTRNSLSMSLDTILKQMGEVKDDNSGPASAPKKKKPVHHRRPPEFSSPTASVLKAFKAPDPSKAHQWNATENETGATSHMERARAVSFGEIVYNSPSAYSTSLASSAISDLILAPLNVGETLDEELKGESLFATNISDSNAKDSHPVEGTKVATQGEGLLDRGGEAQMETGESISQLPFEEQGEGKACDNNESQPEVPPAAPNPETGEAVVSKREGEIEMKESESPMVMKKIHLSVADEEMEGDEMEDCIDLFPDSDDDLLGDDDVGDEPLAKLFSKCSKPSPAKTENQTQVKRTSSEVHKGYHSPIPQDDGGFESSFEKPPALMPYKTQQVSMWVADQQKRMKFPSQSVFPPPSHLYGTGGKVSLLRHSGGSLMNPWGPVCHGNSHGIPHGNCTHPHDNGSASSAGAFVATHPPQG